MPALRAYQPFQLPDLPCPCLALALPLPCPCLALALLTGFRLFRLSRLQAGQAKEGERAKEKKTARVKKRFDILKEQSKMAVLTSASDDKSLGRAGLNQPNQKGQSKCIDIMQHYHPQTLRNFWAETTEYGTGVGVMTIALMSRKAGNACL